MADYRAIMALVLQGRSYRDVVAAVGCSHRDVAAARKVIGAEGITGTGLAQMLDTELTGSYGPATAAVIEQVLNLHAIEAQGYLDCQNILETLGRKNKQRLEASCQQLLNIGAHPTFSTLKRLMAGIEYDAHKPAPVQAAASNRKNTPDPSPEPPGVFVRGADYYAQGPVNP